MDTKMLTFLTLCRKMNYRKTAQELHLTQPAVTKQIQGLEQQYGTKLFIYNGHSLQKTRDCIILEEYAQSLNYNYNEVIKKLAGDKTTFIRLGATKTIGDYVIGDNIKKQLKYTGRSLSLVVDNTERLLSMLDCGELDFAVIEGLFNKIKYDYRLLCDEPFVGICKQGHPFDGQSVTVKQLQEETVIVREEGSGTRRILEHELKSLGFDLNLFAKTVYISSFKLIRELVADGLGISFVYKSIVGDDSSFGTFEVEDFGKTHEFNIVYLKNTQARKYAQMFFDGETDCSMTGE